MDINTDYIFKTMLGANNDERLKVEELLEKAALEQTEVLTHKLLEGNFTYFILNDKLRKNDCLSRCIENISH